MEYATLIVVFIVGIAMGFGTSLILFKSIYPKTRGKIVIDKSMPKPELYLVPDEEPTLWATEKKVWFSVEEFNPKNYIA